MRKVLVAGCLCVSLSCRSFVPTPPQLFPSGQLLLEKAQQSPVRSVKALARVRISSPGRSGSFSQIIAAQEPSSLRLETLGPLGNTLFILAVNGKNLEAYASDTHTYYTGAATQENISRLLPFALAPEAIVTIALGKPNILTPAGNSFSVTEERKGYILTFDVKDLPVHQSIVFSRDGLLPLANTVYDKEGTPIFTQTMSSHKDVQGILFPIRIDLVFPSSGISARISFKEVSLNSHLHEDIFFIDKPSDAHSIPLDEQ